MMNGIEEITTKAMSLPLQQRLALAGFLLESAETAPDPEAEAAWNSEIQDRIQAIDVGRVRGVPYEDVLREEERRLALRGCPRRPQTALLDIAAEPGWWGTPEG